MLEHEMTHFLLRRSGIPPYDSTEHVPFNSQNILTPGTPPAHPLFIPTSEQAEIRDRILNGRWDDR